VLNDLDYPDKSLIDDIASGFKLNGWMPRSHVFKPRAKRPAISMETLKTLSKALNATTYRNMSVRQEPDIEAAAWEETEEEVQKGWFGLTTRGVPRFEVYWKTLWHTTIEQGAGHR
jgi:hypothetical protein